MVNKLCLSVIILINTNIYCSRGIESFLKIFGGPLTSSLIDARNNNVNQSFVNPSSINEDFNSIIVDDNVKENFDIIISFLKNPEKFKKIGAKIPRGVLLYGPPGTGKTSLGRALAKESNSNFIYLAGSEADDMWVGTGAQKIKDIFNLAKSNSPAIIFIDEINTIAKKRSTIETRFHQQTLQQFLVEMDGFKKDDKPIVVIATTNNIEQLDEAVLRSGRFDIHLKIDNPNYLNRKKIFISKLQKVKTAPNVNEAYISEVCKKLENVNGADIENIINRATLNAIKNGHERVRKKDLDKIISQMKINKSQEIEIEYM